MNVRIESSWNDKLSEEFNKPYFYELAEFVRQEYRKHQIYPAGKLIFNAFDKCPFDKVKVVILGQDPYHSTGYAHGLCFSVPDGIEFAPSLWNIFKELKSDLGVPIPKSGNLERWAKQGVFMLNSVLTVRAHQAGSHQGYGWERFTDEVVRILSEDCEHLVFILWGSPAQLKARLVDSSKHLILQSVHPSPYSAHLGFFGNHHFSKTNEYLKLHNKEPIYW